MPKQQKIEQEQAIKELQEIIKPGDKIYTLLRRVSASGMSRCISLKLVKNGEIQNITHLAARAMRDTLVDVHGDWSIRVGGCGMDMGFNLVYNLGRTLFPQGFTPAKAGKKYGRNMTDANEVDTDGGYALNHEWL